ncbi:MAG: flagellar M-ring protein FliF [Desulfovibrio sp.]|nr:flagellar M-ring protein FliF [Desulfovibrio sp.]
MTQLKSNAKGTKLSLAGNVSTTNLEELRAQHRERMQTNKRVDELKLRLLRITDHHMDQAVRLIRRWLRSDDD